MASKKSNTSPRFTDRCLGERSKQEFKCSNFDGKSKFGHFGFKDWKGFKGSCFAFAYIWCNFVFLVNSRSARINIGNLYIVFFFFFLVQFPRTYNCA